MDKEVKVGEKTYLIKELKYKDVAKLGDISKEEAAKTLMKLSTGIIDEEYDKLSMKEGIVIQKVINELNGFDGFQTPLKE